MEYVNQHFVTEAYLKAWCDPESPNKAFVWRVSRKDRKICRKSPRSLFFKPDFYTIYDSNGHRILELEHKLNDIEEKFLALRDEKLQSHQQLEPEDRWTLALFISTMFARTNRQKEEGKQIWQEYIDLIETLPSDLSEKIKHTDEYKQVLDLHRKQPMPYHLFNFVNLTSPYLAYMNCAIYETELNPGLLTSDNPCIWFDPSIYNPNIHMTFFGIGSPTLNILFPISPKQFISLERNGPDGYIDLHVNPETEVGIIDSMNRLIALNCDDFIVVNQNTFDEKWFSAE
jgi:hypothetical protein